MDVAIFQHTDFSFRMRDRSGRLLKKQKYRLFFVTLLNLYVCEYGLFTLLAIKEILFFCHSNKTTKHIYSFLKLI